VDDLTDPAVTGRVPYGVIGDMAYGTLKYAGH
jgi:hypothetical protein